MKSISIAPGRRHPAPLAALLLLGCVFGLLPGLAIAPAYPASAQAPRRAARIFVLMVWDGLRPDFVTAERTPNLFAMENEGVRFARHHAVYPTITMVNAASMATGAPPGGTTILGDEVYLPPRLSTHKISPAPADSWANRPVNLESSAVLAALNGPKFFNGALLGSESLGQQVRRTGGYLAIIGKKGPTFTFDDSLTGDPAIGGPIAGSDFIFVADDLVAPDSLKSRLAPAPPEPPRARVVLGMRDTYFARIVTERALPQARAAALGGHPALVVFWQHNPDLTQHRRGLGTQADLDALKVCDANLAGIRNAIAKLGIADRTDLMVVSDHGFATIRAMVPLAHLLVANGLKKSAASDDVMVVANGGTDLIHLSRAAFPTLRAQRAILQKITDFVESEPWSGPLFTRTLGEERALDSSPAESGANVEKRGDENSGWIDGTFSLDSLGMIGRNNYFDAPDLVVSFRELPEADNRGLTGPGAPTYMVGEHGEQRGAEGNRSAPLVAPVKGVMYADTGGWGGYGTGLGMHAAAGARELHNFCAAVGPDFRRHFVDRYPSGNLDLRPTIALAMDLAPGDEAGFTGRPLDEALAGRHLNATTNESRLSVSRALATTDVTTTLDFSVLRAGPHRWSYLDGAEYKRAPLTKSK
ncbi:MAG TPA: alkaline phosphatase family protein [Candidatus Binataceae bacterium]|nr:alkaline phosphatase family protein [Candidatus Binataceae bacterium]